MMTYEVELLYDEYCIECAYEGKAPKSIWQWYYDDYK